MENICEENKCTGCGACKNICPKAAIKLIENRRLGHFIPQINQNLCIECRLCEKTCPANGEMIFNIPIKTLAAWNTNESERITSSSGGIASGLYLHFLKKGYKVVGARYDTSLHLEMKLTDNLTVAKEFKGSKYQQCDAGNVYTEVKDSIVKGNSVLFIGTPCQCAAVVRVVGERLRKNLYVIDFICHGVPSEKIFHEYLGYVERKSNHQIDSVSFRNDYGVALTLIGNGKKYWERRLHEDPYLEAFISGMLHRESCYQCTYARTERVSDLTIGDFWGLGKTIPFDYPNKKVSVILVNNDKGNEMLRDAEGKLFLVERTLDEAVTGNAQLRKPSVIHSEKDKFEKVYIEKGLYSALAETILQSVNKQYRINSTKRAVKSFCAKLGFKKMYKLFKEKCKDSSSSNGGML